MASKVAALVRNFLQTEGDALYLVAGEKIFITRGTARNVAGREVVSEASFRAVVDELVPGVPPETLAQKRSRLPYVAGTGLPPVEIHFALLGGAPAMMIVRPGHGPGGEAPRTPVPESRPAEALAAAAGEADMPPAASPAPPPGAGPFAVGTLLALARGRGASDVFLSPEAGPLFRVPGNLVAAGSAPPQGVDVETFLAARAPARAARSLAGTGSARFVLETGEAGRCLFRAARSRSGTSLAVRLLAPEPPRLEALGLPDAVSKLAGIGPGLVLVAGPPGSGRTTTLAALATRAAQGRGERVVTVEDPVEVPVNAGNGSVSAREVGLDVPSMRAGLRAALTEDADVVLAGEISDAASAALLVEIAASGRLVLAPVPAPSLALALQWLDARLPEGRRTELRALLAATFRGGVALALCRGRRGGRLPAVELLYPGSLVSGLILGGGLAALADELRDAPGYVSLNESLAALVGAGLVDAREALVRSLDRPALLARLREGGAALPPELAGATGSGAPEP